MKTAKTVDTLKERELYFNKKSIVYLASFYLY